jgi:hypothetical protein
MRHRWDSPEIQAELAAKSAMGMSATEIAKDIGATKDQVASAMTRYGLFASSRPERKSVTLPSVSCLSTVH